MKFKGSEVVGSDQQSDFIQVGTKTTENYKKYRNYIYKSWHYYKKIFMKWRIKDFVLCLAQLSSLIDSCNVNNGVRV